MTRGIMIAGNEGPLFTALAGEAVNRVESFASVIIPNRFLPEKDKVQQPKLESGGGAIPLSWNPASPISARTVILAAENRLGQINDAVLVCSPPTVFKTVEDLEPEDIEFFANDHIKGWFFLIRELIQYFSRTGSGTLALVVPEINPDGKNAQVDLLGPSAAASFRTFAQSVLAMSANGPFLLTGFNGPEPGAEQEFADWLFKIVDEGAKKNRGRWLRFSKLKLFR